METLNVVTKSYKTLGGKALQDYFAVEIETRDLPEKDCHYEIGVHPLTWITTSKHVFFTSRIHVQKRVELTFSFSGIFTDYEILHDHNVMTKFLQMYGNDNFIN